jgi:hypothetical protein
MQDPKHERAPGREITPFAGLSAVLAHLTDHVRAILGDNLVGLYLQGSFAVGDADEHSDCDFVAVTARDLTADERARLQAMHAAIHDLPHEPWRHRLEGSYAPVDILRRRSDQPRDPPGEPRGPDWGDPGMGGAPARFYPFVYLDHGAKVLVRSEHDNSQVVRWSLREKGVVLAGPDPRTLIDPVTPEMLRTEVRQTLDLVIALDLEPMPMKAWQSFYVGLCCRILHTLATGVVSSKKAGTAWALTHLDPRWAGLIAKAQEIKEGPRDVAIEPPDPEDAALTRVFARYAAERADHDLRARALIARRLAEKQHNGRGDRPGAPTRSSGPGRSSFIPPTHRPDGRGRRG